MMRSSFAFILLSLLSFFSDCMAQEKAIKVRAYLDVSKGRLIKNKIVVINKDKITKIVSRYNGKGQVINLGDSILMPGLIDCHTHLFLTQTLQDKKLEAALEREAKLSGDFRKIRAQVFMKQYLKEGFTSLCDLGNSDHYLDVELKKEIKNKSGFPRLFVSGPGLATSNGQFAKLSDPQLVKKEYDIVNAANVDKVIDEHLNKGTDILKVYLDNSPGEGEMDKATLAKILAHPDLAKFKKVTFHAILPDTSVFLNSFRIESTEHFYFFLQKRRSAYPSLKFATLTNLDEETLKEFGEFNTTEYQEMLKQTLAATKSGVALVFGSDFYFHNPISHFNRAKYVKRSLKAWSEAKVLPLDIIRALTINAARSLKMSQRIGVIAPGADASFIALKNDPTKDIATLEDVQFVMNRGDIIH